LQDYRPVRCGRGFSLFGREPRPKLLHTADTRSRAGLLPNHVAPARATWREFSQVAGSLGPLRLMIADLSPRDANSRGNADPPRVAYPRRYAPVGPDRPAAVRSVPARCHSVPIRSHSRGDRRLLKLETLTLGSTCCLSIASCFPACMCSQARWFRACKSAPSRSSPPGP